VLWHYNFSVATAKQMPDNSTHTQTQTHRHTHTDTHTHTHTPLYTLFFGANTVGGW